MAAFEETPGLVVSKCFMMSHVSTTLLHVRQCTHLFAHTFLCTYFIILMILFVYYCCFIYIYIYTYGERDIHTFVSVSWLPSTEHPDLSWFSQAFSHDSCGTISEHDAQRAPLDPMKSHGSHVVPTICWHETVTTVVITWLGGTTFKENTYIYISYICVHICNYM